MEKECRILWSNVYFHLSKKFDPCFLDKIEYHAMRENILCISTTWEHEEFIRKLLMKWSFSKFQIYALFPDCNAPRWIIPLDNRCIMSNSLRIYVPWSLKGKVFKFIASNLAYLGIQRIWGRNHLVVASKTDAQNTSLIKFLQELLGVSDIHLAFSTGTPGYYRKITAQVMSGNGKVVAYAKIADTQQAQRKLIQETRMLRCLAELNISTGYVPQLIYAGQFHGNELLVQSSPSGKTCAGIKRLDRRHIEFLAEIFNQTNTKKPFLESGYWTRIKKDVELIHERISDDWRRRLQIGLDICESTIGNKIIPFGLCHCDFVPWNTYIVQERLYVFDWEYGIKQGIPLWDVFHFVSFPAMLVNHCSGKQIISRWQDRKLKRLLTQYIENVCVDTKLVPVFFLLYLIEMSCFYLDMFTRDGLQDAQRQWMQKNWAEMIDELTIHWEQYRSQWQ